MINPNMEPIKAIFIGASAGGVMALNKIFKSLPENYNTGMLILEGSVKLNGSEATENQFVLFENIGTEIDIEAIADSILLVLSGEPIDEPIYPYGPFLMNNKQEIIQAYKDLEDGKFGYLED